NTAARLLWEEARQYNEVFFEQLGERMRSSGGSGEGLALHDEPIDEPLSAVLGALAGELALAAARVTEVDSRMELTARVNGLDSRCGTLRARCVPTTEAPVAWVRWLEPRRRGPILCGAPLDVSAGLREHLWKGGRTAVLTSATLGPTDDRDFTWLRRQLGLDD